MAFGHPQQVVGFFVGNEQVAEILTGRKDLQQAGEGVGVALEQGGGRHRVSRGGDKPFEVVDRHIRIGERRRGGGKLLADLRQQVERHAVVGHPREIGVGGRQIGHAERSQPRLSRLCIVETGAKAVDVDHDSAWYGQRRPPGRISIVTRYFKTDSACFWPTGSNGFGTESVKSSTPDCRVTTSPNNVWAFASYIVTGRVVADLARIAVENDDSVAVRAAGELEGTAFSCRWRGRPSSLGFGVLFGGFARAFDEDFDLAAEEGVVVFFADLVLEGEQFVVAAAFDFVGDVVGVQIGALGAGAFAVLEDETVFETRLADEVHRELELVFGFAAEADDEIARHGDVRNPLAGTGEHFAIVFHRVAALHALEHGVRTALDGNMKILTNLGQIADGGEQVVRHVLRDSW